MNTEFSYGCPYINKVFTKIRELHFAIPVNDYENV